MWSVGLPSAIKFMSIYLVVSDIEIYTGNKHESMESGLML